MNWYDPVGLWIAAPGDDDIPFLPSTSTSSNALANMMAAFQHASVQQATPTYDTLRIFYHNAAVHTTIGHESILDAGLENCAGAFSDQFGPDGNTYLSYLQSKAAAVMIYNTRGYEGNMRVGDAQGGHFAWGTQTVSTYTFNWN